MTNDASTWTAVIIPLTFREWDDAGKSTPCQRTVTTAGWDVGNVCSGTVYRVMNMPRPNSVGGEEYIICARHLIDWGVPTQTAVSTFGVKFD